MSLPLLALAFLVLLLAAYRLYGGWIARQLALDDGRPTPAHARRDDVDFVPTRPFYLFGQHFSAIAAAGPIAGPILACQAFGWLPCLLWIGLGVVLIGAVHDFSTLAASVRHGARSIVELTRERLGTGAGRAILLFIWLALIYVIVAFADITAGTFVSGTEELRQGGARFNPGGAVAAASVMYLALAVLLGVAQRFLKIPLWLATMVFVPATFAVAWLATRISEALILPHGAWALIILVYCAVSSVVPVWALLQPRGYLGGFVLYTALAAGVLGVFFGGYAIEQPAFAGWNAGRTTGALFPFLFVTIACGACSGFHGLVCSGTTPKQIDRESHIRPVGYGAMLAEGFVALIALVTIMIVPREATGNLSPGTIYGNGIGEFLTLVLGRDRLAFAVTFGAMAFSTFVFDTLDVCTRLGRYIVQELFGWQGRLSSVAATLLTLALPAGFLALESAGSWIRFWTLFGASNQLLAALTLLALTVWLRQEGRRSAFVFLPMLFVLALTLWALVRLAVANLAAARGPGVELANGLSAVALVGLALYLAAVAAARLRSIARAPGARLPSA
jgi:carbon starvation protein